MDRKFLVNIITGLFISIQLSNSSANVTDITELYKTTDEVQPTEIYTTFSPIGTSNPKPSTNASTDLPVTVTESSKRKKTQLQQGRPRRQGYDYGFYPARYGITTLFDMCPPVGINCPKCTHESVQAPPGFCNFVVLKVLAISHPQTDDNGRVCGKFGMLKLFGDFNEKEFRRLLRFSARGDCNCPVKASSLYFLISPLSNFLKDGLLFNQIVLTEETILIPVDRYIEKEILDVLNSCPLIGYNPDVSVPYILTPTKPPISYAPPPIKPPKLYVSQPTEQYSLPPTPLPPYNPPPVEPPAPLLPYNPPPVVPPAPPPPYNPPPVVPPAPLPPYNPLPITPYNPPPVQLPVQPVPVPSTYRGKMPFIYPSLTKCLIPDICPVCARLDNAGDITGQYCIAGFAYLAVIRVPDASSLQGADSTYSGPTCMNLRTNIVYDITRTRDPTIMVSSLTTLLPTRCLSCFEGLNGPVIVMIMGQVPPAPPVVQLDASFQVYILPVPATVVLPSCGSYSVYGIPAVPYSLLPIAPAPYTDHECPEAGDQSCPLCQNYPDTSFAQACAYGFAIIAELNLAGPYFTSQRLPIISVKTTTTYYSKSVEVIITDPPRIECIKGFFKIIQNIGLAPMNFPGEIIPFVSLPNCECLSQGFKRLLIFSSGPLTISDEGYLHLSKDINIAFLQPEAALPTCSTPPPPSYVPQQPFYIPPHQVHPSPYTRPAREPLTYVPPPPPPPAYIPPTDPPPVYILPPNYIPPPVKDPSPWHIPPQPTTLPPPTMPEKQPPSYTTKLPFEETPSPIINCSEFGKGSCVVLDTNQDEETQFFINVDEEIPFPHPFEDLNSIIYEDSSVWSSSFEECLSDDFSQAKSFQLSCPHSLVESPEKFEEFFCNAKTALIIAVGIDYGIVGNVTAVTKRLTFIQPELPYIGINYDAPTNPKSLKVAVTQNKTMDRRIQLQNKADYCYKEKVLVLSDLSDVLKPKVVVGALDVYVPGFCDSEIFDKIPSYGILLSMLQPSDVKNPVQLTEDFAFIPLQEGKLGLPDCGKLPKEKPSTLQAQSTKFWVPISPLEEVNCHLPAESCGAWTTVEDEYFSLPCDGKFAVLVLVQNTSAGNSVGPNLEILETSYESGEKVITLSVELNVDDENAYPSKQNQYADDSNRCKFANVQVLKDFSQSPTIDENDVLTIIANTYCDNPIFKLTNQVVLLLSDEPIYPNASIPLHDFRAEVFGIPPGTTTISFCNVNPSDDEDDETLLNEDLPVVDESIASVDNGVLVNELVDDTAHVYENTSDTYKITSNIETYKGLETSCKGHADDTCPVCADIDSISSEVYCNSELSLFAEVIEQELRDGTCTNGVIASLFDVTVRNGVPESKVFKISYSIPTHCSCPALKEGEHLVLLLDESTDTEDELSINLSQGKYLYSAPMRTKFPSCRVEDSVQARSKNVDNVIVLDSPYKELRKILPELSMNVCPKMDHSCPICRSMDDKELEDLYCSSEEVLLVSRNKNQKKNLRIFPKIGKATFTLHRVASNYTLEMNIDKYESVCSLPKADGNCSESLDRFYFDVEDEMCHDFIYTGCGGNANNFLSQSQCENICSEEDFCEEGILDVKKILKDSYNANYAGNKFHFVIPEHCHCSPMLKGDKKGFLLLSKGGGDLDDGSIQLTRDHYFVPLSKNQRKMQFSCKTDDNTADSREKEKSGIKGWFG